MRFARIMNSIKTLTEATSQIKNVPTARPLMGGIKPNPTKPKKPIMPSTGAIFGAGHKRKLNEQTLIETIKKLAKDKNCKSDKKDNGDNPKGAPEGFELNPEINSSIQNR